MKFGKFYFAYMSFVGFAADTYDYFYIPSLIPLSSIIFTMSFVCYLYSSE